MHLDTLPPLGAKFSKVSHPLYPGMDFLDCLVICRCPKAVNIKFGSCAGYVPENAPLKCLRVFETEISTCDFQTAAPIDPG